MLDLSPIKTRLDFAATHEWTMVENNWSTTTIYSGDSSICTLQLDEEFEEDEDLETYIEDQRNTAIFITNTPTDIKAMIDEIERLRKEMLEITRCASIESAAALAQDYLDKE